MADFLFVRVLHSADLFRAAAIVRNAGRIGDALHDQPPVGQPANGGFPALADSAHKHVNRFHAKFRSLFRNVVGYDRRRVWRGFFRALEIVCARGGPAQNRTGRIRDCDAGIVHGRKYMRSPVGHFFRCFLFCGFYSHFYFPRKA